MPGRSCLQADTVAQPQQMAVQGNDVEVEVDATLALEHVEPYEIGHRGRVRGQPMRAPLVCAVHGSDTARSQGRADQRRLMELVQTHDKLAEWPITVPREATLP